MTFLGHRNLLRFMAHLLEMACESLVQPIGVGFTDVHDGIRSVALALADEIDTRPAAECTDPIRVSAARTDRAIAEARVADPELVSIAGAVVGARALARREVDDHCGGCAS